MINSVALDVVRFTPGISDERAAELVANAVGGWMPSGEDEMVPAKAAVKWARRTLKDDPDLKKRTAELRRYMREHGEELFNPDMTESEIDAWAERAVGA